MATTFQDVYDAFLAKILDDEWAYWTSTEIAIDLNAILEGAIPYFKFPRTSLARSGNSFTYTLTNDEIQILAAYMKVEWLNRTILSWENVKPLYSERDFSQASLLDKFKQLLEREEKAARRRESNYYRSVNGVPYSYSNLAGDPNA